MTYIGIVIFTVYSQYCTTPFQPDQSYNTVKEPLITCKGKEVVQEWGSYEPVYEGEFDTSDECGEHLKTATYPKVIKSSERLDSLRGEMCVPKGTS